MIIRRYLNRELLHAFLAITLVLLVVVISNMMVRYLSLAAAGGLSSELVLKLIGLTLPWDIAILLPISFFLSILLVYSRLFANKELLVMQACGLSWWRLLCITYIPGLLICICVAVLTLYVTPAMSAHQDRLKQTASSGDNLQLLKPGRFISLQGGSEVVYIGDIASDASAVSDLFVFRQPSGASAQVIVAPAGVEEMRQGQQYVVLRKGHLYRLGDLDFLNSQVIEFEQYAARLEVPQFRPADQSLTAFSTWSLLDAKEDSHNRFLRAAELQWRLTLPLGVLILTLWGVAFAYVGPRQGRYLKMIPAILLFILYFNLLTIAKNALSLGKISPVWGLWWIHALFLMVGLIWIYRLQTGRWRLGWSA